MKIKTLAVDLAKSVFQLHGADEHGKPVLRKKVSRSKLVETVQNIPPCRIVMEACGSANYWARRFRTMGHDVQLISPQHVKPFVKGSKNDRNDAEAIFEAACRPSMTYVPVKSVEQQDIQAVHRIRSQLVKNRTALANQIRGLLAEYGIVMPQAIASIRKALPAILDDTANELSGLGRELFADLYEQLRVLDERIARYDHHLQAVCAQSPHCRRLLAIPGIGPVTASALVAAAGDGREFRNGRHFAAWLGLVPRQHSSGGKERLLGITKRGDKYLRSLMIHGSRAVVSHSSRRQDSLSSWINGIQSRSGSNVAAVALANKTARIVWAVLSGGREYRPAA